MKTARIVCVALLTGVVLPVLAPAQTPDETAAAPKVDAAKGEFVVPRTTWRVRNVIGNDRLLKWRVGIAGNAFGDVSLVEAAARADALSLNSVEGSSSQRAGPGLQKKLDDSLTADERATIRSALRNVRMLTYRLDVPVKDELALRELFKFAKAMGAETIVAPLTAPPGGSPLPAASMTFDPARVAMLNTLAEEFSLNVALFGPPEKLKAALAVGGKRLGVAVDTGAWIAGGTSPVAGLAALKEKEKIFYVSLRDRSAHGEAGRDVVLGEGIGKLSEVLRQLNRSGIHPLTVVVDRTAAAKTYAEVEKNIQAFEAVVQPALGDYVTENSRQFPIRGLQNFAPEQRKAIEASGTNYTVGHPMMSPMNVNLPADVRQKIDAALPKAAPAKPKKARKLLVIDACVANMSHNVIPHANYAIEQMGKRTGAYEAIFSNDFNNLKYPKIREFDAIFLNSTVGELFPDPEVRDGLTRFVREGGGIALLHGATYASRNWPEFAEMVGAADGPHRVQPATLRVERPDSPITKPFPPGFRYSDEYYRFYDTGPTAWLTRDKVHVLLSIDLEKTPDFNEGKPPYIRKDNDYPICWIKSYGKGRVFENAMGHTPELFMTPPLAAHVLAGIQFVLGDLEDDTTPGGKLAKQ